MTYPTQDSTTALKLINIGFGNTVSANRVIAIVSPESAPIKRVISDARDRTQLIDATYGRRTRAVMIVDSGHVILSAIQPETVCPTLHHVETSLMGALQHPSHPARTQNKIKKRPDVAQTSGLFYINSSTWKKGATDPHSYRQSGHRHLLAD